MGFKGRFEYVHGWGVTDSLGERVPEGGGCHTKGSVPEGPEFGSWFDEEAHVCGPQRSGWDVVTEEIGEVLGGQAVEGFVGEQEEFISDAVFDREPV